MYADMFSQRRHGLKSTRGSKLQISDRRDYGCSKFHFQVFLKRGFFSLKFCIFWHEYSDKRKIFWQLSDRPKFNGEQLRQNSERQSQTLITIAQCTMMTMQTIPVYCVRSKSKVNVHKCTMYG